MPGDWGGPSGRVVVQVQWAGVASDHDTSTAELGLKIFQAEYLPNWSITSALTTPCAPRTL